MVKTKVIALATLVAIIVPTITITLYFLSFDLIAAVSGSSNGTESKILTWVFVLALTIAGAHVLILGLPAVLILNKFNKLNVWALICAGFIAGCIPMSIWSWPVDYSYKSSFSYWNGKEMVIAKADGVPTLVGWLDYIHGVAFMGVFGIIAALSFWWVWKRSFPNKALQPSAKSGAAELR